MFLPLHKAIDGKLQGRGCRYYYYAEKISPPCRTLSPPSWMIMSCSVDIVIAFTEDCWGGDGSARSAAHDNSQPRRSVITHFLLLLLLPTFIDKMSSLKCRGSSRCADVHARTHGRRTRALNDGNASGWRNSSWRIPFVD